MKKGFSITSAQFSILVFFFTIGSSILLTPTILISSAGKQGWIAGIIGIGSGTILAWLYASIGTKQNGTPFVTYLETTCGRWIGTGIALYYFFFFMILAALVLRNIGDFLTIQVLPETPIFSIHMIFMMVIVYGISLGLLTVSRFGQVVFPVFVLLFCLLVLLVSPQIEFKNALPLFPIHYKQIIKATIPFLGFPFFELSAFLALQSYVKDIKQLKSAFCIGTLLGSTVLVLLVLLSIFIIGTEIIANYLYPSYYLAQKIRVAQVIERIEIIMAILWFITVFFKITVCFLASLITLAGVLRLQTYQPLTIPLSIIIVTYATIFGRDVTFGFFGAKPWPFYSVISGFFVPVFLLLLSNKKAQKLQNTT